ncbi:unnamed protein product [Periconia digitata]|uniref:Uncharacterized protein n=1 Tax=Periconia digitata TaxID=1303443 RepID=A0A9W4XYQ1_9PLEO|nr:unnamed protein product [Periconia digitata]
MGRATQALSKSRNSSVTEPGHTSNNTDIPTRTLHTHTLDTQTLLSNLEER